MGVIKMLIRYGLYILLGLAFFNQGFEFGILPTIIGFAFFVIVIRYFTKDKKETEEKQNELNR